MLHEAEMSVGFGSVGDWISGLAHGRQTLLLSYTTSPSVWFLINIETQLVMLSFSPSPFQYGFNMVMSHPHAVNEIALSLNNKNPR